MRFFIAINFNSETQSQLIGLQDELRARTERGRFTPEGNLHLTLAFLGECNSKEIRVAKLAADSIGFVPFAICIDRVGRFKRSGGDIWWAGVREDQQLSELQSRLTDKLITAGFELETRKYKPHITLGRDIRTDAAPWEFESFGEKVERIELIKSERIQGKLIYTPID